MPSTYRMIAGRLMFDAVINAGFDWPGDRESGVIALEQALCIQAVPSGGLNYPPKPRRVHVDPPAAPAAPAALDAPDPWRLAFERYLAGKVFVTIRETLTDCMHMHPTRIDRAYQIRAGRILRDLGWRDTSARVAGKVTSGFRAPAREKTPQEIAEDMLAQLDDWTQDDSALIAAYLDGKTFVTIKEILMNVLRHDTSDPRKQRGVGRDLRSLGWIPSTARLDGVPTTGFKRDTSGVFTVDPDADLLAALMA